MAKVTFQCASLQGGLQRLGLMCGNLVTHLQHVFSENLVLLSRDKMCTEISRGVFLLEEGVPCFRQLYYEFVKDRVITEH